jgi:putative spermidine/putrescine transport system substrate-binding protein
MKTIANLAATVASIALVAVPTAAAAQSMDELIAGAREEGMLTTIALPHDWCGYGEIIAAFKEKYPFLTVNELNPDAGSADEIEAIRANRDNRGPQAPDVIDVGLSFGPLSKDEGLIQPYMVSTWDEIPDEVKDPEGYWYGSYYGVMAFGINKDLIETNPTSWDDLKNAEYANSFALTGDPRASNQAILAILSAGLSQGAEPGAESGERGLALLAEINAAGNFVPVTGRTGSIAQGQTPIVAGWDYNLLNWRDQLDGNPPVEVVIPEGPVLAGVYVQAISAYAPHPNAAKLWMEHIFSDEGQNGFVKGYCHTARFNTMVEQGKVPQEYLDALPPAEAYTRAVFPSVEQQAAHREVVTTQWDSVVGASVE